MIPDALDYINKSFAALTSLEIKNKNLSPCAIKVAHNQLFAFNLKMRVHELVPIKNSWINEKLSVFIGVFCKKCAETKFCQHIHNFKVRKTVKINNFELKIG